VGKGKTLMNTGIPLKLAMTYMEILFSGKNLERLRPILADDFLFCGPFYQFDSADAYIKSLQSDPPKKFEYKITGSFGGDSSVCLFFQFKKPGVSIPMAQMFEVKEGKISEILLVFDTDAFT
jgi:hypothetical protein